MGFIINADLETSQGPTQELYVRVEGFSFNKVTAQLGFQVTYWIDREHAIRHNRVYLEEEVKKGTKVNHIMRHTVGLYHGQPGSKEWKRYLSDNMMARDSDFQKAKHIMDIAQNNEKANQLST